MTGNAPHGEITRLLISWRDGSNESVNELFSLVYRELRVLARRQLRRGGGQTLDTTELVHEGYLKLVDQSRVSVQDRAHFFAVASRVMRHILVDHARRRSSLKRGGGETPLPLAEANVAAVSRPDELLAIDQALGRLESLDPRMVRLVEMRFFAGLSVEETAGALEISPRTVKREWVKARAFLHNELRRTDAP
jgi:RNA polymerase sigma factor (TIGR02999 family)